MSKHTINHQTGCKCLDCMINEFDASWCTCGDDARTDRPWTYCRDCEADEYMTRTECCAALLPSCNTIERRGPGGTIEFVECRAGMGCHQESVTSNCNHCGGPISSDTTPDGSRYWRSHSGSSWCVWSTNGRHEPSNPPVTKHTRAPQQGRVIVAPCGTVVRVYHFAWFEIGCTGCGASHGKYEYRIGEGS
jgi:hypothetical protein